MTDLRTDQEASPIEDRAEPTSDSSSSARTVSVRLTTVRWLTITVVLSVAVAALTAALVSARSQLADRDTTDSAHRRAEQVATDYALGASTVDFADLNAWVGRLKANTTGSLADQFDATAPKLQEILTPLRWTSTAQPISAKVRAETGGIYTVDTFINVTSTNVQNPEGAQTTVTYTIEVDSGADWKISDVGGTNGALPFE